MSSRDVEALTEQFQLGAISRRQFVTRGLALGVSLGSLSLILQACAGAAAPSSVPASSGTAPGAVAPSAAQSAAAVVPDLSVLAWGGSYGDALKKYVSDPFEQSHGDKVLMQEQSIAEQSRAKLVAEKDDPTIDIWLTTGALPTLLAKSGGLEELTADQIPNLPDVIPQTLATHEGKTYGAGIHLGVKTISVDSDRIRKLIPDYTPDMLNSWGFLWRPELKDNISLNGFPSGNGTIYVGMTMNKGASQTDEEAFFKAMRELAPNVHLEVGTVAGIGELAAFQSKEIVAAANNMVDAQELISNGLKIDVGYPQDPLVIILDYIVAIKNGPASKALGAPTLAFDYINDILNPSTMTPYDTELGQLPTNAKAALPDLKGLPPLTVDTILKKGWSPDYELALQSYDAWFERYQKEIVPLFGK